MLLLSFVPLEEEEEEEDGLLVPVVPVSALRNANKFELCILRCNNVGVCTKVLVLLLLAAAAEEVMDVKPTLETESVYFGIV